jgi:hypothetical protein
MERPEMAAARAEAIGRKKQDRRNVYTTYTDAEELRARLDGVTLPRVGINAPEFRDPVTLAEFWDDRVIEWSGQGFPEAPVMTAVAVAVRDGGADAARAAVAAARLLEPAVQWSVYLNLKRWEALGDAARFGADRTVGQVLGEWSRLKLPTEDPATAEQPPRRRRHRWETDTEATA